MDLNSSYIKKIAITLGLCITIHCQPKVIIDFSPSMGLISKPATKTVLLVDNPQNLSNKYAPENYVKVYPILGLFIGKKVYSAEDFSIISGIKAEYAHALDMSGKVYQFALPGFDNFRYQYSLRSTSLAIKSKILINRNKIWKPYASVSLGGAYNKAFNYSEAALVNGAVPMNPFANGSKLTFTYSLGAGFQLNSNEKFTVGLGYEFSDLGQSKLGLSSSQTTSNNFALNHLIIHKLVANLIWDL